MIAHKYILDTARGIGFDLCGVARYRPMDEHRARIAEWLSARRHGGMEYLERNVEKRLDPAALVEGAQTVIVCAVSYNHGKSRGDEPRIASYALCTDYHIIMKGMLEQMLSELRKGCPSLSGRAFTDSAPILEKAWAVEAGLGWIGRNSLLITPSHGSLVLLGELIVDVPADSYDRPYARTECGGCTRCVESCPAKAITSGRTIDANRCIARQTIEKGEDPQARLHGWIYGCDVCQEACPHNKTAIPASNGAMTPVADPQTLTTEYWQTLTGERFLEQWGDTPLARPGLDRIRRHLDREK